MRAGPASRRASASPCCWSQASPPCLVLRRLVAGRQLARNVLLPNHTACVVATGGRPPALRPWPPALRPRAGWEGWSAPAPLWVAHRRCSRGHRRCGCGHRRCGRGQGGRGGPRLPLCGWRRGSVGGTVRACPSAAEPRSVRACPSAGGPWVPLRGPPAPPRCSWRRRGRASWKDSTDNCGRTGPSLHAGGWGPETWVGA